MTIRALAVIETRIIPLTETLTNASGFYKRLEVNVSPSPIYKSCSHTKWDLYFTRNTGAHITAENLSTATKQVNGETKAMGIDGSYSGSKETGVLLCLSTPSITKQGNVVKILFTEYIAPVDRLCNVTNTFSRNIAIELSL